MKYLIPTYKREIVHTVVSLLDEGISPSDIILGTQRLEDYEHLLKKYGNIGVQVILSEAHNAGSNRNALLDFCYEPYVFLMDDDITSFNTGRISLSCAVGDSLATMKKHDLAAMEWDAVGVDPENRLCSIWEGWAYSGMAVLLRNKFRFDESFDTCEDVELFMRLLSSNEKVAYCTKYRCKALPSGTMSKIDTEGGCADLYKKGSWVTENQMLRLTALYPQYIVKTDIPYKPIMFTWGATDYYEE